MKNLRSTWFLFAALLLCTSGVQTRAQSVTGFPEGDSSIERLLLHFDGEAGDVLFPVYRDLARGLASGVKVTLAVEDPAFAKGARYIAEAAGFPSGSIEVIHPRVPGFTPWARDRLLVSRQGFGRWFTAPSGASVAKDRRGDADVGFALSEVFGRGRFSQANFAFEGGNIIVGRRHVITGRPILERNPGMDARALTTELERTLGAKLLLIGDQENAPHVHADMYLTMLGGDSVLLGDTNAGARWLQAAVSAGIDKSALPKWDSWTVQTQLHRALALNEIEQELKAAGYSVHRTPMLIGEDGGALTWNNALVERRSDGRRVAYVPSYGIPQLDDDAQRVFRERGISVVPIDVSRVASLGGTVRCLTNVIEWSAPKP